MAFLNALGKVSRHGQWRFRRTFRAADPTGRRDLSDNGLIDFSHASALVLTVTRRPPYPGWHRCAEPAVVVRASLADGTLQVFNPGLVEALFPDGWGNDLDPGLCDVRLSVTIGPETSVILSEPVELV